MKNISPITILLLIMLVMSCDEQPRVGYEQSEKGFNLRVIPNVNSFDISQGDPEITFTIYTDNKNIAKAEVWVELTQFATKTTTDRGLLTSIDGSTLTSKGSTVALKLSEFASAVDLAVDDLVGGDIFTIYNIVELQDGRIYPDTLKFGSKTFTNVENSFVTASTTTSFTSTLSFPVLCPFLTDEAVGTYAVTRDDFETYLDPDYKPEIVAGNKPNQVIIKNIFGHPENPEGQFDVVVDVNPVTDVATVVKQPAWECTNFFASCTFGIGSVEGSGFFFSCTGFLTLDLKHTVSAGSFGTFKLELTKE